jgi:flagellar biosynthesis protein FlhG
MARDQSMSNDTKNLQAESTNQSQSRVKAPSKSSSNVFVLSSKRDNEIKVAQAFAEKLRVPFVDPLRAHIEPAAAAKLDPDIAFELQSIPVRLINNTLLVAMAAPDDIAKITTLKLMTACKIHPAAASQTSISAALQTVYGMSGKNALSNHQIASMKAQFKTPLEQEKRAFTISIISNKGGVGKTHFSINTAYALAKTGAKVLLIDADFGNADISNKLGIFAKQNLQDFLRKNLKIHEIVVRTGFHFDLICSKFGDFKLANLNYSQKIKFLKHFKSMSRGYDFVVFDLGAGISRTVIDFALAAERTVIVTTPQDIISGYACAKASFFRFKEIEQRLEARLTDYRPHCRYAPLLVVNQVNHLEEGTRLYHRVNKTANENININESRFRIDFEYLGAIPYDRKSLHTAERKKRPLLLDAPYVKASQSIQHISNKFLHPEDPYNPKIKFRFPYRRFVGILAQK